jgi:multicomponent Na+:H+ antiporter subunit F
MSVAVTVIQLVLGLGVVIALVRAIKGPTLADRMVATDLILTLMAGGAAAEAARSGSSLFVPVVLVVALIAFTGTVVVARFVEWRDVPGRGER